jgi:hypothetical protein
MTILDAFNAAAGLTNQTLGMLTKEREYEIETDIHLRSIEQTSLLYDLTNAYTHFNKDGNNPWHQDAEGYKTYVEGKLKDWYDAQEADARAKGLYSRYFKQRLDELDKQGRLAMAQRYSNAIVEVEKQKTAVTDAKAVSQIENAGLDAPSKFNALYDQFERTRKMETGNVTDHAKEYAAKADIFTSTYAQALKVDIGNMTTGQAKAQRDRQLAAWESEAGKRLTEGETIGQYVQNKTELLKNSDNAITLAVWERNKLNAEADHQNFKAAVADARGSTDQGLRQKVYEMRDQGRRFVEQAVKSSEFEPGFQNDMRVWYQLPAELDPDKDKGGSGRQPAVTDKLHRVIAAVEKGEISFDHFTAKENIFDLIWDKEGGYPWSFTDEDREYYGNDIKQFKDATFKDLYTGYVTAFESIIGAEAGNPSHPSGLGRLKNVINGYGKLSDDQKLVLDMNMQDFVFTTPAAQRSADTLQREAQRIVDLMNGMKVDDILNPKAKAGGLFGMVQNIFDKDGGKAGIADIEAFGEGKSDYLKAKRALGAIPELVNTGIQGSVNFLSTKVKAGVDRVIAEETKSLENAGYANLLPMHDAEGAERKHDLSGQIYYNVGGSNLYVRKIVKDNKEITQTRTLGADGEWQGGWQDADAQSPDADGRKLHLREEKEREGKLADEITRLVIRTTAKPPAEFLDSWNKGDGDPRLAAIERPRIIKEMMKRGMKPEGYTDSEWAKITTKEGRDEAILEYFRKGVK